MTDQMDRRLEELVQKLASSAPEAPPFPESPAPARPVTRRVPAWVLATAGAAAVLIVIGLPFLVFGGRRSTSDPISPPAPTSVASTPTTAPTPPQTTTPTTVPDGGTAPCVPGGLLVRDLGQDGAAGHVVTPLRFTNVSGEPCTLTGPDGVTGIGEDGTEVAARLGTYIPIGEDSGPVLEAGESRTMLVEVGTGCEGGRLIGPAAESLRITIATGDIMVPFDGDLGCDFAYTGFGRWLEEEVTSGEQAIAVAFQSFAADPSPDNFSALPFTEQVVLTLGPVSGRSQPADTLVFPQNWAFDTSFDGFRGYVGPFSALDVLAQDRPVTVTGGTHDHCASPPVPVYPELEGLRQVSIQPADATSCLEWWTVDLFLTSDGFVAGVTLDLYEP